MWIIAMLGVFVVGYVLDALVRIVEQIREKK